jgi:hypothetical protein
MSIKTTTTAQKLQLTAEEYEALLFGAYARWCESVTINARQFQQVLANSAINKWYLMEYTKCEKEFNSLTDRYDSISADDYKRCYNDCTYGMFNIRPTALLQEIKKTRAVSCLKIHGVQIPSLIFNQN